MIQFVERKSHTNSFVVERKGLGHPDTLADGIAEYASIQYSKYCLENFGTVLHHNLDKTYISGGLATAEFGIGHFSEPIKIYINGRCSSSFAGTSIPLQEIFENAVDDYLSALLPYCQRSNYRVLVHTTTFSHSDYWFKPRSLADVPDAAHPHANDTSYTVGYWPTYQGGNPAAKDRGGPGERNAGYKSTLACRTRHQVDALWESEWLMPDAVCSYDFTVDEQPPAVQGNLRG